MSTTPTPEQPSRPSYGYAPGVTDAFARMPIPGNAELIVLVLALVLVAIIALAADAVGVASFVDVLKWLTAAYLISRGVAKASRVLEQ